MNDYTQEKPANHKSHSHTDDLASIAKNRLLLVFILTALFMFIEAIVGYLSNSLALVADAGHMLNDVISIAIAFIAIKFSAKKSNKKRTFGYKRVEVLSGLVNGISLIFIGGIITMEAIKRFQNYGELEINGPLMLTTAIIGMLVNFLGIYLLKPSKDKSINMEGAYEHIIADLLGSFAAIIAGIGIIFWNTYWLDLAASIIVSFMVIKSGSSISIRAANILLETSPEGIDLEEVIEKLKCVPGVIDIHDFHAWRITNNLDIIMAHVTIEMDADQTEILQLLKLESLKFGFHHPTFQFEFLSCSDNYWCCELSQ